MVTRAREGVRIYTDLHGAEGLTVGIRVAFERLPGPWRAAVFRTRDAVQYGPFFGPRDGDEVPAEGGVIVPGGWTHEHCEFCAKGISDDRRSDPHGFTNGEEWICRSCGAELGLDPQPEETQRES